MREAPTSVRSAAPQISSAGVAVADRGARPGRGGRQGWPNAARSAPAKVEPGRASCPTPSRASPASAPGADIHPPTCKGLLAVAVAVSVVIATTLRAMIGTSIGGARSGGEQVGQYP